VLVINLYVADARMPFGSNHRCEVDEDCERSSCQKNADALDGAPIRGHDGKEHEVKAVDCDEHPDTTHDRINSHGHKYGREQKASDEAAGPKSKCETEST